MIHKKYFKELEVLPQLISEAEAATTVAYTVEEFPLYEIPLGYDESYYKGLFTTRDIANYPLVEVAEPGSLKFDSNDFAGEEIEFSIQLGGSPMAEKKARIACDELNHIIKGPIKFDLQVIPNIYLKNYIQFSESAAISAYEDRPDDMPISEYDLILVTDKQRISVSGEFNSSRRKPCKY